MSDKTRRSLLSFSFSSLLLTTISFFSFASLAQVTEKEILIGTIFPMTGGIATYGQESMNGINLALKKINSTGIKNKSLKLINEDNKSEAVETANAIRKLVHVDKVIAVLGSVASSHTLAAAPIAQEAKVPLVTPASTNPEVTKKGDFIARTCFTDDFQGVVMAKFAKDALKKTKAAIIVEASSDYSKGLAKVFKESFSKMGGTVISEEYSYQSGDTDFRTLLRKLARTKPDVIFLPGYYEEAGLILNQARSMDISVPFLGTDGWDSPKLQEKAGEKAIVGNYMSSHFTADDTDPAVSQFVKEYEAQYKSKPGAMAALGYDGIMVLADSLKRAKNLTRLDLKQAINSTKNYQGITGIISLDKDRNAKKSAVVLETTAKGNVFKLKVSP